MDATPGTVLRELVAERTVPIPGAPSALVGRLIERMGFDAVYLSGAALSAGVLGLPDVGLFTLSELIQQVTYLTRSVNLPVIVDADTGFGDVASVERMVLELEAADAAAVQIEDQESPKRCGHLSGKTLIETDVMCARLRAASAAKSDPNFVIVARTDARGVDGIDAAIHRARRYLEAGADWVFPEALTSREEFAQFAQAVDAPLVANMTEFGKSPLLTMNELAELGYAAVLYPVTLLRVSMKAIEAALALMAQEGTQEELLDLMQTREELYDLLDYEELERRTRGYYEERP